MLHKIELKNFKNFLEFRLDKFAQINLIVGKNNVGKTNLLESLLIYWLIIFMDYSYKK